MGRLETYTLRISTSQTVAAYEFQFSHFVLDKGHIYVPSSYEDMHALLMERFRRRTTHHRYYQVS